MKKKYWMVVAILFIVAILIAQTGTTQPVQAEGSGTEADPYLITNLANLRWLSDTPNAWGSDSSPVHIKQTANINATETSQLNNNEGFLPIGRYVDYFSGLIHFRGNYDGQNFIINGLFIDGIDFASRGLFGYAQDSFFSNLGLVSINYVSQGTNMSGVGGIVGEGSNVIEFNNCFSSGSVTLTESIWSYGTPASAGGLIGYYGGYSIYVINSFSTVDVSSLTSDAMAPNSGGLIGGLVGGGIIQNSYSTRDIFSNGSAGGIIGLGQIGSSSLSISNTYSIGNITHTKVGNSFYSLGGIIGRISGISNISLINCYSLGVITSYSNTEAGGLIGYNSLGPAGSLFIIYILLLCIWEYSYRNLFWRYKWCTRCSYQ